MFCLDFLVHGVSLCLFSLYFHLKNRKKKRKKKNERFCAFLRGEGKGLNAFPKKKKPKSIVFFKSYFGWWRKSILRDFFLISPILAALIVL